MIYLQLLWVYLKIGTFGFGGGYAMLSLIQHEIVDLHHWLTPQQFTDVVAISPMTPGPIGINLGMLKAPLHYYDNVSACSLCYSCSDVCPVKVDLAEQIYLWRQDLDKLGKADTMKKIMSGGMEFAMNRPWAFNTAMDLAPVGGEVLRMMGVTWGKGRDLPKFAKENFNEMWKKGKVK